MKTLWAATAIVLCLAVSACAGTGGRNGFARGSFGDDVDVGKVIAVNEWAEKRGATVMWINYPTKPPYLKEHDG